MNNNYYIYELIDPRNNKVFYVGKGKVIDFQNRNYRRIKDHLNLVDKTNKLKNNIINKILLLGLSVKFNIYAKGISEEKAFQLEKDLIKKYGKRIDNTGNLVNMTDGGEGISGYKHSENSKKQMSLKHKEFIKINGPNFKGRRHTPECRKRLSEIQKEIYKTRIPSMKGRYHTEATKKKISDKQKGHSNLPKEMWYKFSNPREKNPQAKKYTFISPDNEKFLVNGFFKNFIKQHNLSYQTCLDFKNKGRVPPPKNLKHNRVSKNRFNTTGWSIILNNN